MRFIRSSILTLLLVAWTAIESGTVALLHEQLHACGAHRHVVHIECDATARAANVGHGSCGHAHHGAKASAEVTSCGSVDRGYGPPSTDGSHPEDCVICRHGLTARSLAAVTTLVAPRASQSLVDVDLPESPHLAWREILRTRGPPCRTLDS